jgi:elongation factor G
MHADKREEIDQASAGDIVAVMGIDGASGDTYAAAPRYCTLESMFIAPIQRLFARSSHRAPSCDSRWRSEQ